MELEARLNRIEQMLFELLDLTHGKQTLPMTDKWLTEPQVMQILNLSKRGVSDLRRNNKIRASSATGRNFRYYKPDVEKYLYENSTVRKRTVLSK